MGLNIFKSLKLLLTRYDFSSLHSEGCDSTELVGFNSGPEFIVFDKDQVELSSITKRA